MGGSDQWGNIVTGTELIRRMGGGGAFAMTTQLIKKADGNKFGKTESGAVWLDPERTSPYKFYQFWLNASDEDAKNWIRIFSLKSKEEIEAIEAEHATAPHMRALQKALATEITIRTHSEEALQKALTTSDFLFSNGPIDFLSQLTEAEVLEIFEGIPQFKISRDLLGAGLNVVDMLAEQTAVFTSKGEARKMIQGGGLAINRVKVPDASNLIQIADLVSDRFIVVQKGKKNYFLITVA